MKSLHWHVKQEGLRVQRLKGEQAIRAEMCESQVEWRTETKMCNIQIEL